MAEGLNTSQITDWRSIITLVVFIVTNIIVLFPFHIPIFVPRIISNAVLDTLSAWRVTSPRQNRSQHDDKDDPGNGKVKPSPFVRLNFPMNFVTAPLIADLFLLAILAIGQQEVHDGTLGANSISPIDIMVFFLSLAYIAISIDASGLIRYLAFKVLDKGGKDGPRLFFYLYAFFFGLGTFIGNDPIILSGTAFIAYMTRVSSNINHPRAWIHTQFAVANTASAILVSSNPTNLVLASAFQIKFVEYTTNMIVPVVVTAIVLFPFLLYIVFADENYIPSSIKMHDLPKEAKKTHVNPNIPFARDIPYARGLIKEQENQLANDEQGMLNEIIDPFLDKRGATFGGVIMATTLSVLLGLNAANQSTGEHPVFWVTLPAAFVMFCWDVAFGWYYRDTTRKIAREGRQFYERSQAEKVIREEEKEEAKHAALTLVLTPPLESSVSMLVPRDDQLQNDQPSTSAVSTLDERQELARSDSNRRPQGLFDTTSSGEIDEERISRKVALQHERRRSTLVSLVSDAYRWSQETFPTVTVVVAHLPFALLPFALSMFVLVQALVTKGWVSVFAYGWDNWVNKTGTLGAIGSMGFLSVILCNFAGTNIGTTILLSRVIQAWQDIHSIDGIPSRTFWATVYSMALGVNYGAYSTAFSASLAGLLWRDILARKHINVGPLEFARVNLPIISMAMAVGCIVLVGEVYIFRDNSPYNPQ